ncbi:MAG: hypothetical protein ACI8Y4_004881 [Candidatus Poriferisodalaceae bacterium]|jgi:hypothetical protein
MRPSTVDIAVYDPDLLASPEHAQDRALVVVFERI